MGSALFVQKYFIPTWTYQNTFRQTRQANCHKESPTKSPSSRKQSIQFLNILVEKIQQQVLKDGLFPEQVTCLLFPGEAGLLIPLSP